MFKRTFIALLILMAIPVFQACQDSPSNQQQQKQEQQKQEKQEPWSEEQLMEPAELAGTLKADDKDTPVIISLGAGNIIGNSKDTGPSGEKEGLQNLRNEVKDLPRDTDLVIYCGCCPFEHCPNVRPAFSLLNEMGFENHKLLNFRDNIKVDWIDKGYPVSRQQ